MAAAPCSWFRPSAPATSRKACLAVNRGPVYLLGTGESVETPMISFTRHSRESGPPGHRASGLALDPRLCGGDDNPLPRGEADAFIAGHDTAPGVPGTARGAGRPGIPLNTNGGGLSYVQSGMYGMYTLQESVRQMRGTAPAQIPGARITVCHGVGA
jgi:hypothetical protein